MFFFLFAVLYLVSIHLLAVIRVSAVHCGDLFVGWHWLGHS
jgi:hypothetical protein